MYFRLPTTSVIDGEVLAIPIDALVMRRRACARSNARPVTQSVAHNLFY